MKSSHRNFLQRDVCETLMTPNNWSIKPKTLLDLDILMWSFISVCTTSAKKINGNCKYNCNFSNSKKHICQKLLTCIQNITWPRYPYDKSVYRISFQYVQPLPRKWTETAIIGIFRSPRRITLSKIIQWYPKSNLTLIFTR